MAARWLANPLRKPRPLGPSPNGAASQMVDRVKNALVRKPGMNKSIFIRLTRPLLQRQPLLSTTNVVNASRLVNNPRGEEVGEQSRTEDTEALGFGWTA